MKRTRLQGSIETTRSRELPSLKLRTRADAGNRRRRLRFQILEQRRLLACDLDVDFGDAPYPYWTALQRDGAVHCAVGPTLGPTRDTEPDGQSSSQADGDGDDEDGVRFGEIRVGQIDAHAMVSVHNFDEVLGARLDAWIDFNGDGSWGGPWEQVADDVALSAGETKVEFDVPSWASSGSTFARFRLSTAGDLGLGGTADDGEVEDYRLTISPPAVSPRLFEEHTQVGSTVFRFASLHSADLDGDGDADLLGTFAEGNRVVWYENRLNQAEADFGSEQVISHAVRGPHDALTADLDGDGDLDVLAVAPGGSRYTVGQVAWFENRLNELEADFGPLQVISEGGKPRSVRATDLDGDGDVDVLMTDDVDGGVAWYENRLDQPRAEFSPRRDIYTSPIEWVHSVHATDVDGDGDFDLLSASSPRSDTGGHSHLPNTFVWFENHLEQGTLDFERRQLIDTGELDIIPADLDGDGDSDLLVSRPHDGTVSTVAWRENRINQGEADFGPEQDVAELGAILATVAVDMDGDGDLDVLSASSIVPQEGVAMRWHENRLDQESRDFAPNHRIAIVESRSRPLFAGDIDGDGDADVLTALSDRVTLLENPDDRDFDFPSRQVVGHSGVNQATSTAVADIDGDGDLDVIGGHSTDLAWYENRLTSQEPDFSVRHVVSTEELYMTAVVAIDIDGDNDPDIVASSWDDGRIVWYENRRNDGLVEFGPPREIATMFIEVRHLFVADLDGDGDNDVISGSYGGFSGQFPADGVSWHENRLNQPEADFAPPRRVSDGGTYNVAAADIDGDGDLDLLNASYDDEQLFWHANRLKQDEADFGPPQSLDHSHEVRTVVAADFDGDGDQDVAANHHWYENRLVEQEARFEPGRLVVPTLNRHPVGLVTTDFDGDGDHDLLAASYYDGRIAVHANRLNEPEEGFGPEEILGSSIGMRSALAADVDNDGDIDVLHVEGSSVTWFENLDLARDRTAPRVSVSINGGQDDPPDLPSGPQPTDWSRQRSEIRSLLLRFSEPVVLEPSSLVLTNLGVDADLEGDVEIPLTPQNLDTANDDSDWLVTFSPGQLSDGVYRLVILPATVDRAGNPLDGDGDGLGGDPYLLQGEADRFFVLRGDWDGDGAVSLFDFATFTYWFGRDDGPRYVDLNGDGGVSILDFPRFANVFGTGILFPAGPGFVAGILEHRDDLGSNPLDEHLLDNDQPRSDSWIPGDWVATSRRPMVDSGSLDDEFDVDLELEAFLRDAALAWQLAKASRSAALPSSGVMIDQ